MSTRDAATIIDAKLAAAYHAAPKATQEKALSAFRRALTEPKPVKSGPPRLSKKETDLFLRINRTLSERQARRLEDLNEKIEGATLTEREQAELLRLAKKVEKLWVDRLQAIADLAEIRGVSPAEMMRRLEIEPPDHAE